MSMPASAVLYVHAGINAEKGDYAGINAEKGGYAGMLPWVV